MPLSWKTKQQSFHIICNLVSFEETGGLSCKSKIYTTNGAGLGLVVLREDNGSLDKLKSAGGVCGKEALANF